MSGYILDSRDKQSFPAFWILGSLFGAGSVVMGCISIYVSFSGSKENLYFGIGALIVGLALLAGVIYTLKILADPDDLSLKVDVNKDSGKKKYSATKLARYIDVGHNNVLLFNTDDGQLRIFGYKGRFVAEIMLNSGDDFRSFYLIDPNSSDREVVILGNLFFEKFPTRKNRIVGREKIVEVIDKLYSVKALGRLVSFLPFEESTEETKRLIAKDAYITPSVPFVFHKKPEDNAKANKEKEERFDRAVKMLRE